MLGGDIAVQSVPGEGSTFTLTIATGPLDQVPMLVDANDSLASSQSPGRRVERETLPLRGRILLAEDAPDTQRLISFLLRDAGAEVEIVADGAAACEKTMAAAASGAPFDVVLMDMQMPLVDGYQATAWLRSMGYKGRILALTAHAMEEDRVDCLRAGCDDFATKPIDPERLIDTIRSHLQECEDAVPGEAPPLLSRMVGRPELFPLLVRFVERLPERARAMEESFDQGNLSELIAEAHRLKGTAGGYGFPSLTEAAANLEATAKAQLGMDEIRKRLDCVADLCRRARIPASAA
jgi:CheY-like chemotaxis protein/HPt (histidine-containing phosphotransfer) domain-containing protein